MFYSPLKNSIYRAVWIATFFSNIGTWVHTVSSSLLMTKLTTSSTLIALVQTSAMLPIFMFAIPAGVIADLYNRRNIVIYAQILMSVLAFSMALVTYLGAMNDVLLLVMTFMLNIGLAFNQPAWQALSSTLVMPKDIKQTAALNNLSFNVSRCIGPAIAGFYFAKMGAPLLFILNGLSFLGVIWVFKSKVTIANEVKATVRLVEIVGGFKRAFYFFNEFPNLKFILTKSFLYFLLSSCLWASLPYIVVVFHHMSEQQLGFLTSAAGIGAVLNAYYIYKLRTFLSDAQLTTLAMLLAGLTMILFAKFASFKICFLIMLVFGFSWSLSVSVFNGILQAEFPKETRSRLIGIYYVFFAAAQALGSYLSGRSIQIIGVERTLLDVSFIVVFVGLVYMLSERELIGIRKIIMRNR